MSFAALRARMNDLVLRRLGDVATRADGSQVMVKFERQYFGAMNMVESSNPVIQAADGAISRNEIIAINGVSYKAVRPEPDGTGLTVWQLERV